MSRSDSFKSFLGVAVWSFEGLLGVTVWSSERFLGVQPGPLQLGSFRGLCSVPGSLGVTASQEFFLVVTIQSQKGFCVNLLFV